ncbi:NADP-dependent oxidoreductase [uncultured Amnibacterium sp.]|uniref:NADP-dependent oxidoreductase n=1 Tax=uncultured Amnibacterium sp. TaxID=1631851 RepID=UPI0035CB56C4
MTISTDAGPTTTRKDPDLPDRMRAAVITGFGEPDALHMAEVPVPVPVGAELLVRVIAAGVNPIDAKTRAGRGAAAGLPGWPAVLGSDFSGVVMRAPYESFPLQPGDEVYGVTGVPRGGGSLAEYVAAPAWGLARKPRTLSHVEAAGVPLAALTAWGAVVEQAKAHEGQRILIHAGAGGVGHFAVQFASYFGARVIATASSRNTGWLRELGAAEVIDYTRMRFEDGLDDVDAVIDLIGDAIDHTGSRSLSVLRPGGLLINVPSASWPTLAADAAAADVRATTFRMIADAQTLAVISRLITSGDVRVNVDEVFPLEEAGMAHRRLEEGHVRGKLVVQIAEY